MLLMRKGYEKWRGCLSKRHRHSRCQEDPGGHSREFPGTVTAKALPEPGAPLCQMQGIHLLWLASRTCCSFPTFSLSSFPALLHSEMQKSRVCSCPHPQQELPCIPCLFQPLRLCSCGHGSCKDSNYPEARLAWGLFAYSCWACFSLCLQPANSTHCLLTCYHRILPCWQALLPAPSHLPKSQPSSLLLRLF